MNLKEILRQIDANSDKLLHGRSPRWWRSSDHVLALDAVRVGPSTPSWRAKRRGNPCLSCAPARRSIAAGLDCFDPAIESAVAFACDDVDKGSPHAPASAPLSVFCRRLSIEDGIF